MSFPWSAARRRVKNHENLQSVVCGVPPFCAREGAICEIIAFRDPAPAQPLGARVDALSEPGPDRGR